MCFVGWFNSHGGFQFTYLLNVCAMFAAVLWLGNVTFSIVDNENHVEPVIDETLQTVSELLGCGAEQLQLSLSTRKLTVRGENIIQKLNLAKKPLGLLTLLDEESTFPNGTNMSFADKLKQHLKSNPCFRRERSKAFTVHHYAGEVTYDTTGFLEKNRDLLHLDSIQLLSSCTCKLPHIFASSMFSQSEKPTVGSLNKSGGVDSQKLSVMLKFKLEKAKQKEASFIVKIAKWEQEIADLKVLLSLFHWVIE